MSRKISQRQVVIETARRAATQDGMYLPKLREGSDLKATLFISSGE